MIPYARLFHDHGFNVLMPDARAIGESDGHRIGFGWTDRKDYLGWVNKVIGELGADVKIVLMGFSMGAATVLAAAGEHLPQNVKAVVADSGFASIYQMAKRRFGVIIICQLTSLCQLLIGCHAGALVRD